MTLLATIGPALAGECRDHSRRQALLAEIIEAFDLEGEAGVKKSLERKTDDLAREFRKILGQLETRL